jgi:hypothetical protein
MAHPYTSWVYLNDRLNVIAFQFLLGALKRKDARFHEESALPVSFS